MIAKRDNIWLEKILYEIWEEYFNDVPRKNLVVIKFGKNSIRQLGCIRIANEKSRGIKNKLKELNYQDEKSISVITITKLFQKTIVPEYVVKATIAHELCHYTHGFNSPLKQIYNHPHKGGIVSKEMKKRSLDKLNRQSKKWMRMHWREVIKLSKLSIN